MHSIIKRKAVGLTQPELASKGGVGLRFVRDLEQGKSFLVNLLLIPTFQEISNLHFEFWPIVKRKNSTGSKQAHYG